MFDLKTKQKPKVDLYAIQFMGNNFLKVIKVHKAAF